MKKRLALIDYGRGNLRSVANALGQEGAGVQLVAGPDQLADAAAMVLPGVGSFGDCVRQLHRSGLWDPVREWLAADRPFLGICLGYQMLFEGSDESPGVPGLGHFPGRVRRFRSETLKIPHMGWNTLELQQDYPLWNGLGRNPHVFFVHSFFPEPEDPTLVTSRTDYGETFAASIGRGNLAATQFHPEKSQAAGLTILRNFIQRLA